MEERHARIIGVVITVGLICTAFFTKDTDIKQSLWGAAIGASIATITALGGWVLRYRKQLKTIFQAMFIWNLRISCSYLYRIKVDDYYLLIKSRKHGKFQPVGGNFKRNKFSYRNLRKIEVKEDDKFSNGRRSNDDLRLYIRGYRLPQFLKWYNSPDKEREVSYDREFYEELVEPGFFPSNLFKYPVIDFIKQVITPVRYSRYLKCFEVHIYDIVELCPTHVQQDFLSDLLKQGDGEDFKWATSSTIRQQGYQEHKQSTPFEITDHSIEILT